MRKNTGILLSILFLLFLFFPQQNAWAMHIMEGFLPLKWCLFWYALTLPFLVAGILSIQKAVKVDPGVKMLLGLAGAFAFVLSALKLPSVTGSCSHPTGVGLGAILFGPWAMSVLGCIVLLFQAVLLAHGGLTTLGANTFSMAVVGPLVAYVIYRLGERLALPRWLSVFLAAFLGDLLTYVTTSIQLALAFPASHGGVVAAMIKFMGIFAVTQVPLAISEGILTIIVFNFLVAHNRHELEQLRVLSRGV
ncbi:energy-coupling factor ABC transporter permease [Desulfofundulus salinus]|uniref:Cobalt transport protein CbiM n=1 Tax=Desulfofundulus salinus TaxID=2419843 RepID=A0A494WZJ4_9FIRM|nr:energy-coupling factor ABC transporter permease [Desulfofundulus salinum]RKO66060.1 energy-coupling factor ABC transporter permease [Desulfofundulus salinum]